MAAFADSKLSRFWLTVKLTMSADPSLLKIIAISSMGGHWHQLLRLRPAFVGADVVYISTDPGLSANVPEGNF